jgi:hypothetical protein
MTAVQRVYAGVIGLVYAAIAIGRVRRGVRPSFTEHLRAGVPVTLVTLAIGIGRLLLVFG